MHRRAFLIVLLLAVSALRAAAPNLAPLDAFIKSELSRANVPGTAVAVVLGGEIIYAKGFGIANVDTGDPVKPDMLFRIGSTTKMFTAATLVSLAEEGKVKLDAPIGDLVKGLAPKISRLTPHQLLTHSSGLADTTVMEGPHDDSALAAAARALPDSLTFAEPGKIYSYSNPGFWLAGLAAETAGGKPYADMVAERVLKPCGMIRSTFRPTAAMTWPLAVGHGPEGRGKAEVTRPLADNAGGWPAGQLFTTAPEFARFCIAFMSGGKVDGKQALSPFVIEKLSTPHVAVSGREGHYGYGLTVKDEGGLRWLSHGGSRTGYGSFAKMCPEKKFAVIALCNKSGASLPRVVEKAVELALGIAPAAPEPRKKQAMSAEEMKRLAGTYGNGQATMALRVKDGQLVGAQGGVFAKVGENRYLRPAVGSTPETEFIFSPGLDGTGAYLIRQGRALKKQ
ncbi:MAG: serine hydrolase [Verrucomicrobia bacterium]|nr:serine hydrolase [Verrucomicrobiota bacterium]